MNKTKTFLAGLALGAATITGIGWGFWPEKGGAHFCCDAQGENCVLSVDGDCELPVQWCAQIGQTDDGVVYCAEW